MRSRTAFASLTLSAALVHAELSRSDPLLVSGRHRRAPNNANKVVVQLFGWSWKSIAAECESFLGPAGVGFALVNPPQEHLSGGQWWADYQAVSYQLQSSRGSRAEFAEMVSRCQTAGVKIMADTLWNHMAGVDNGVGTTGTQFAHYNYPGVWLYDDFHHCGTKNDDIQNWSDRRQIWDCQLYNLADLKTAAENVRDKLAAFTNDMLSLGVDGLRLDAAKHIPPEDIRAIVSKLSRRPAYITQEIVDLDGSMGREYTDTGDVQEFRYPRVLKNAFERGGIASLKGIESRGFLASNSANVFVTNHDEERRNDVLTYKSGNNAYTLAHVFMLSYPYGTPTILSSYVFNNYDAGPPNGAYGTCQDNGGSNGWLCQHRWVPISGMIRFYNQVGTSTLNKWIQGSNQQIAFGRGNAGYVVINNDNAPWTRTFKSLLPNGTYCDVISGKQSGNACTGGRVTISSGQFTMTVPGRSAVAYHIGAKY